MTSEGSVEQLVPDAPPRVLSLSEAATRLNMKRPNVAKFLARRGVQPAFAKAQGYFYDEAEIDRIKAEREADPRRMASDERRRRAALRNAGKAPATPLPVRLGPTQRNLMASMLRRPVVAGSDGERLGLARLERRALAQKVRGGNGAYQLTSEGRRIAALL